MSDAIDNLMTKMAQQAQHKEDRHWSFIFSTILLIAGAALVVLAVWKEKADLDAVGAGSTGTSVYWVLAVALVCWALIQLGLTLLSRRGDVFWKLTANTLVIVALAGNIFAPQYLSTRKEAYSTALAENEHLKVAAPFLMSELVFNYAMLVRWMDQTLLGTEWRKSCDINTILAGVKPPSDLSFIVFDRVDFTYAQQNVPWTQAFLRLRWDLQQLWGNLAQAAGSNAHMKAMPTTFRSAAWSIIQLGDTAETVLDMDTRVWEQLDRVRMVELENSFATDCVPDHLENHPSHSAR